MVTHAASNTSHGCPRNVGQDSADQNVESDDWYTKSNEEWADKLSKQVQMVLRDIKLARPAQLVQ